jgi:hypothetical protein
MSTALAHRNDPDTSHIAAAALNPSDKERIKAAILVMLGEKPKASFQLTKLYFKFRTFRGWPDCKEDGIAKRLSELVNADLVIDTGKRVTSPYKRPAVVWAVAL